jgi:hypothetical protein
MSGFDPTLTIEALASMSAEAIVNRYQKSPARSSGLRHARCRIKSIELDPAAIVLILRTCGRETSGDS